MFADCDSNLFEQRHGQVRAYVLSMPVGLYGWIRIRMAGVEGETYVEMIVPRLGILNIGTILLHDTGNDVTARFRQAPEHTQLALGDRRFMPVAQAAFGRIEVVCGVGF